MSDKIMALVVLGLSIFAVAQLIRIISLKLFCPCKNDRIMTVIPIDSSTTDAELLLRSALIRMRWLGIKNNRVVALDCGANEETVSVCRIMSKMYPEISVVKEDEFGECCDVTRHS